jgi:hypothetical protein
MVALVLVDGALADPPSCSRTVVEPTAPQSIAADMMSGLNVLPGSGCR